MTPAEVEAVRARLAAASASPWRTHDISDLAGDDVLVLGAEDEAGRSMGIGRVFDVHDAEFIAHAPADIAALLAALDEARAELEAAREVVERVRLIKNNGAGYGYARAALARYDAVRETTAAARPADDGDR